jgi:hypothetical protein
MLLCFRVHVVLCISPACVCAVTAMVTSQQALAGPRSQQWSPVTQLRHVERTPSPHVCLHVEHAGSLAASSSHETSIAMHAAITQCNRTCCTTAASTHACSQDMLCITSKTGSCGQQEPTTPFVTGTRQGLTNFSTSELNEKVEPLTGVTTDSRMCTVTTAMRAHAPLASPTVCNTCLTPVTTVKPK